MAGGALSSKGRKQRSVGKLRHRLTLQKLADSPERDAAHQEVPAWEDVATVWGSVEAMGGKELFAAGQVQANTTYLVTIRHRSDVTPKHRLVWVTNGDRVLNIIAAPPTVGTANSVELTCVEEV